MTNLAKTQAEWTRLLGRELGGLLLAPLRELRELADKFTRERTQIINIGDRASATPHITALTLTGVDYDTNTSSEGRLWVRFVANADNWDVTFYTAAGASGAVTKATNVAASGTGVLVAQNASGLTGSITLGATIAGDITDLHQVLAMVDYPARLPKVLTQDGTVEDDIFSRRDIAAAYVQAAAKIRSAKEDIKRAVGLVLLASSGNPKARGNAFAGTAFTSIATDSPTEDGDGNVTRSRSGLAYYLADAMRDELTGGEQDVVRRVLAAGAGSFDSGNDGLGTVAAHTPLENASPGTWVFQIVDDTLGAERFDYDFTASDSDIIERGAAGPVLGQPWEGPRGFGPLTVARTLTKTNDGSNLRFAATSGGVVTGENSSNTNDGDVYASLVANGSNWDISFYKAESRHVSTLVAKATNIAASAAFTATAQNQSGLTIAWTLGGTVTAVTNITLELNPFKLSNLGKTPDKFTVAVTLSAAPGLYQTLMVEEFNVALNSDVLASESISDNYPKQGTFTPFITQDN